MKYHSKYDFKPDDRLTQKRNEFWEREKQLYPSIFDGEVLFCDNIAIDENQITFDVGLINYSYLNLILRDNIQFNGEKGYFAFRIKIINKITGEILIGQKSHTAQFDPAHYVFPGGLFDYGDINTSIFKGVMREVDEETKISIDQNKTRLIAINKHRRNNGVILIFESEIGNQKSIGIVGNEEWLEEGLKWISFDEILMLDYELLHDDVRYILERDTSS